MPRMTPAETSTRDQLIAKAILHEIALFEGLDSLGELLHAAVLDDGAGIEISADSQLACA